MLFRNLRRAFREATAACFIDQAPGLVPIRVLEGGTASAGPQGLRCFALGCDAVHFRADEGGIAGLARAKPPDTDRDFWQHAWSVDQCGGLSHPAFTPASP